MVDDHDVIGTLIELLGGSADTLGAAAAGLVVKEDGDGGLEFLGATSHRVEELELYQLQVDTGPCVECVRAIGALHLIWTDDRDLDGQGAGIAQTFADVATIAIVSSGRVPVTQVLRRTCAALRERAVIEQAKGVLAHRESLDMAGAFDRMMEMAGRNGNDLRITAAAVVRQAARPRRS
jgi:hypothetical protein